MIEIHLVDGGKPIVLDNIKAVQFDPQLRVAMIQNAFGETYFVPVESIRYWVQKERGIVG